MQGLFGDVPSTDTHDYMRDLCYALVDYVENGGIVSVKGDSQGRRLTLSFALADANLYHEFFQDRLRRLPIAASDGVSAEKTQAGDGGGG